MFGFIKKLFGFDEKTLKEAGVQIGQAPYKVEAPVNPQCSDSVTQPDGNECKAFPTAVNDQITDAVTQEKPPVAAMKAKKKPAPKKEAGPKKGAPKTGGKPRGRRPKSKNAPKES